MPKKLDLRAKNPYSIAHPQWKHFELGVLVQSGKLAKEDVVSWQPDSPAAIAYAEGYWAADRESVKQQAMSETACGLQAIRRRVDKKPA